MWRTTALALLTACTFNSPPGNTGGDGGDGPLVDAPLVDAPPGVTCYGTSTQSRVCVMPPPTDQVNLPNAIDTDTSPLCKSVVSAPAGCVVVGATIIGNGTTVVTGMRPLILVGSSSISVNGTIDAASRRGMRRGPGANSTACPPPGAASSVGGGSGGSFGASGGSGGNNENGTGGGSPGAAIPDPPSIRGGCPGGSGGNNGGAGGDSGGVVLLVAGSSISIAGTINVSGAGGAGTQTGNRGGGGSGGMIALDTPSLTGSGRLVANGGGGGGGGGGPASGGSEADAAMPMVRATGGPASGSGGDGGDGGAGTAHPGGDGSNAGGNGNGGGGGAGSVGVIRFYGATFAGTRSPG